MLDFKAFPGLSSQLDWLAFCIDILQRDNILRQQLKTEGSGFLLNSQSSCEDASAIQDRKTAAQMYS